MEATTLRIRKRIIELDQEGKQTHEIAKLFGLCKSAVRRIKQHFRERKTLEPLPQNAGAKGKFTDDLKAKLADLVRSKPDATLMELREGLGVQVALSTVDQWTRKLGLSFKKSRSRRRSRTGPMSRSGGKAGTGN
jgi:transposase